MPRRVPFTASIVGVQKAATSTLYDLLIQHPEVVAAQKKERHFFDDRTRPWDPPDYTDYRVFPKAPGERVAIDATPSYMFWPQVLPRMRDYRPEMPLIACFRDPVERAFSHWSMDYVRRADYVWEFGAFVRRGLAAEVGPQEEWRFPELRRRVGVVRGLYGAQLRRGLDYFPREQWLLLEFRDVVGDLVGAVRRITDHLGLDPFVPTRTDAARNPSSPAAGALPVTADDVEVLVGEYAEDLPLFARLSGLEVAHWPTARVLAGETTPGELAAVLNRKAGLVEPG